jgi:hypothetical protein
LDLIKTGQFQRKKLDLSQVVSKPVLRQEEVDPSQLSLQDILQKAASIREAVACSDSSSAASESETTTW